MKLRGIVANCCENSFREAIKEPVFKSQLDTKMAAGDCIMVLLCLYTLDNCLAENRVPRINVLVNDRLEKIVGSILMGLESMEKNSNNLNVDSLLGIKIVRGETFVFFESSIFIGRILMKWSLDFFQT